PERIVGDRSDDLRTGGESTGNGCVRVGDEYPQQARYRGPVRVPVECQYHGVAYPDLTVADQTVVGCHPPELLAVERRTDKVEECPGIVGDNPWRNGVVTLRRGTGLFEHLGPFVVGVSESRRHSGRKPTRIADRASRSVATPLPLDCGCCRFQCPMYDC